MLRYIILIFQYFNVNSRKHKSSLEVLDGPSNNDWNLFPEALTILFLRLVGPKSQWCHAALVAVSCFLIPNWLMFGMFLETTCHGPSISTGDGRERKLRECAPQIATHAEMTRGGKSLSSRVVIFTRARVFYSLYYSWGKQGTILVDYLSSLWINQLPTATVTAKAKAGDTCS